MSADVIWAMSIALKHGYVVARGPFDDTAAEYVLLGKDKPVYLADAESLIVFARSLETTRVVLSA